MMYMEGGVACAQKYQRAFKSIKAGIKPRTFLVKISALPDLGPRKSDKVRRKKAPRQARCVASCLDRSSSVFSSEFFCSSRFQAAAIAYVRRLGTNRKSNSFLSCKPQVLLAHLLVGLAWQPPSPRCGAISQWLILTILFPYSWQPSVESGLTPHVRSSAC